MQTINLLNAFKKPEKVPFDANAILISVLFFVVILLSVQIHSFVKKRKIEKQYHYFVTLNKKKLDEFSLLSSKMPNVDDGDQKGIHAIAGDIESKSILFNSIKRENNSFYAQMQAISDSIVPGVWLNAFSIDKIHDQIKLTGTATDSKLVVAFMENLKEEPSLSDFRFKKFNVKKQKEDEKYITFVIHNIEDEKLDNTSYRAIDYINNIKQINKITAGYKK